MAQSRRQAAAALSVLPAALHLFYASQGGIAEPPALAWALAFATVLGSGLVWLATRRGPWALAWLGLGLIILPAVPSWPAIGVSPGGQLALLLMAITATAVILASMRGKAPAPARSP